MDSRMTCETCGETGHTGNSCPITQEEAHFVGTNNSNNWKVNYRKSQMVPINVTTEKMEILSQTFGCSIGTLPFTYLGLPLGTTKPKMEDLTPMMDRVERSLSGCNTWLSYSGRLQMINSAISPIVT